MWSQYWPVASSRLPGPARRTRRANWFGGPPPGARVRPGRNQVALRVLARGRGFSRNQGMPSSEVWLGTKSMSTRSPRARGAAASASKSPRACRRAGRRRNNPRRRSRSRASARDRSARIHTAVDRPSRTVGRAGGDASGRRCPSAVRVLERPGVSFFLGLKDDPGPATRGRGPRGVGSGMVRGTSRLVCAVAGEVGHSVRGPPTIIVIRGSSPRPVRFRLRLRRFAGSFRPREIAGPRLVEMRVRRLLGVRWCHDDE